MRSTLGWGRLYEAVEKGLLDLDDTLRGRAQKLRARKEEVGLERAKLKTRKQMAIQKFDDRSIEAFCRELKEKLADPASRFGKAYLRLVVDEIRLDGRELRIRGSFGKLADAVGSLEKKKLGLVPSSVSDWRARHDSNVRPLPSEGSTLSN